MVPILALLSPPPALLADLPFERRDGRIWLRMVARGRPVDAILDTGATDSILDSGLARSLGARPRGRKGFYGIGPERATATAVEGAVARLSGTALDVGFGYALPLRDLTAPGERRLGAILGYDFLLFFVVEVDDAASRVRIYDRVRYLPPTGVVRLPLAFVDRLPGVEGTLHLPGLESRPRTLVIDTGSASGINLTYRTVRRERLDRHFPDASKDVPLEGVGGARRTRPVGNLEGRLGPFSISGPGRLIVQGESVRRPSGLDYDFDATVGNAALKGVDLTFDYSRGALYLRRPESQ